MSNAMRGQLAPRLRVGHESKDTYGAWRVGDISASRLARLVARDSRAPLRVIRGHATPATTGFSYYHTTMSGKTIVHHPSAYKWPTLYHPSTRRVTAGAGWLVREAKVGWRESDAGGVRAYVRCSPAIIHSYRVASALLENGSPIWHVSDGDGWAYHVRGAVAMRAAVREAIHSRRMQRERLAFFKIEAARLASVIVTVDASVEAGNCPAGTETFRAQAERRLRKNWRGLIRLKALRGDTLLALRDDTYTRRALRVAAR